jgi:hypothetical protein
MRTYISAGITPLVAAIIVIWSAPARAQDMCPGNMAPTIAALQDCVAHALSVGHIDNAGVATSLRLKLDAAARAQSRGDTAVAIAVLEAFILEVEALAGTHIDEAHASHMVEHAEEVVAALGG